MSFLSYAPYFELHHNCEIITVIKSVLNDFQAAQTKRLILILIIYVGARTVITGTCRQRAVFTCTISKHTQKNLCC